MAKLKDNQALLLMYLADELPASDKEQFKQRLAVDAGLRAELAEIEQSQAACFEALGRLDELSGSPIGADAAAARVGRLMRQWTSGRLARPAVVIRSNQTKLPWWSYPLVSAACAAIAVTVFWSVNRHGKHLSDDFGAVRSMVAQQDTQSVIPPAPDAQPTSPDTDLAELPADQQQELFDAVGSISGSDETPAVAAATPAADDLDNVFLGLSNDDRGGTQ